ncbi:MAG: chaperone NapD [Nitrospiraceae bacterium]|nr:MAG: chaperone NapD [Nitrospiraceae bacterium]
MNISSIVVRTSRDRLNDVIDRIKGVPGCEVHLHDHEGRIVITIEGESTDSHMKRLKDIQDIPYVYSANLAYSYCGKDPTLAEDRIES